ncbi:uncharacterized protein LTR77_009687 [Saxophila tyrrhenica]|uniref:Uncharacterized protein n=1 Tax=Saxophila tyrrhenica TaxID=1690608 RepID=A0AAV9NX02_9PEZI|nr:hypothetical protein LTR77_009687 [Saxophila tyrrhenica]
MNRSWHFQMHKMRQRLGLSPNDSLQPPGSMTPTMDSTTLVTFLFKAPPEARTVELLGSWDNFQQAHQMHHDRRRGRGFWTGCWAFDNIIFDGDSLDWSKPRSGGLKQGGTYWYFYRLNDEVEAYDDSRAYTTSCPLLPGQRLNVMEVPIEIMDPPSRCCSAGTTTAEQLARTTSSQTLNPHDKYAPLEPPPVSKVHGRCVSDLALNGRLENRPHSSRPAKSPPPMSPVQEEAAARSAIEVSRQRPRAYANDLSDHYWSRQSSFTSQRGWSSEAPSFAHSSVPDVYPTTFQDNDDASFVLSPVLEVPSPPLRTYSRVSYAEDVPVQFSHPDPFHDFDAQHSPGYDDDFDGTYANGQDDFDAFVRMPTSPPSGALPQAVWLNPQAQQRRKRTSSLPTTTTGPLAIKPWTAHSDPTHLHATNSASELEYSSLDSLSPSFSAATLSSTTSSGPATPNHLDSGSQPTSRHTVDDTAEDHATKPGALSVIDRVADRFRTLRHSCSTAAVPSTSPPMYEKREQGWSGYSLPAPAGQRKTPSAMSQITVADEAEAPKLDLMQTLDHSGAGESFAKDVFSELGF